MKMQYIEYTKCKKVKFWNENKKNTLLRKYKIPKYTLLLVFFIWPNDSILNTERKEKIDN